ncbi:MAG: hypothetical protein WCL18_08660 [bacterium]
MTPKEILKSVGLDTYESKFDLLSITQNNMSRLEKASGSKALLINLLNSTAF